MSKRKKKPKRYVTARQRLASGAQFAVNQRLLAGPLPYEVKPAPRTLVTGPDAERCGTRFALQMAGLPFSALYPGVGSR